MALTSTMMALGTPAPTFALPNTEGQIVRLEDLGHDPLLVMFICNHCPYVQHIAPELAKLARDYQGKPLSIIAINSNDAQAYPADSPAKMKLERQQRGYLFDYLFDEDQSVALAYQAACTPDFFLFDKAQKLVYRGQLDDTRPHRISSGNYDTTVNPPHGKDLRQAIDTVLAGDTPSQDQRPSIGCGIKWKPGNNPTW